MKKSFSHPNDSELQKKTKNSAGIDSSLLSPPQKKMDAPASAGFSGAIKIGDISDFIAPAQACVVGLGAAPSGAPKLDAASMVDGDGDGGGGGGGGVVRAAERPSSLAAQAAAAVAGTAPVPKPSNTQRNGSPVKVTLNDCLACSGCVTSAETVLLEAQSAAELDAALARGDTVVVTLSQQSVASLALGGRLRNAAETLSPSEAAAALSGALKSLGVAAVVDAGEPRALALLASAAEFCAVYAASPEGKAALRRFAPRVVGAGGPGGGGGDENEAAALAAASAANAAATSLGIDVSAASSRLLPCLASACPGWVCYAEKNAAAAALPHAASAASAQAVAGLLIKRALLSKNGSGSGDSSSNGKEEEEEEAGRQRGVFHVSVMPCADKKLESLRDDLVVALEGEGGGGAGGSAAEKAEKEGTEKLSNSPPPPPGTDCVLTTIELSGWLSSRGVAISDLETAPRAPLDSLTMMLQGGLAACRAAAAATATAAPRALLAPSAGTSGGFGEFVFRHAASTLFGVDDLPPGPLPWRAGRNGDVREVVLEMLGPGRRKKEEGEEEKGGGAEEEEEEGSGTVVLRASLHYGFRNIQTLVTKIKSGASHSLPHFVEVMACPSGCVNGGGQLRGVAGGEEAGGGEGEEKPSLLPPDGRALAAAVYSSLAEELRPNGSDWYSATLSGARALAGVAWPRGRVEPAGALAARVRDRKAEAEAKAAAAAAEAAKVAKAGARAAVAAAAPAPAPMSVDW